MSQFVVSARKYRPATFDEVIGQNHVAKTLKNALQTDHLAHAFLFCGPRGVGKTTCARILAKVINCENTTDKVTPCNQCSSCLSFAENASFNIFELDAASNNSVEHIRNLNEQVRFRPQQGTHKVFIIDEVHMLSTQAFNAFLKTLEEPPPYAIFILATTEKHKILPTILSRCQIFDFKRIQPEDIVKQLVSISNKEGKEADVEALHQIALKADGAMRDALSIYDKVASASDGRITYQEVVKNLNILDYDYFFRTIDACLRSDLTESLLILDEIIKNGFESEQFIQGLSGHIRDLLVSKDPKTIQLMEGSNELKKRYYYQSQASKASFLLSGLNILNGCDLSLPRATNKRLQVELALAKLCYLPNLTSSNVFEESIEKKTPDLSDNEPDQSIAKPETSSFKEKNEKAITVSSSKEPMEVKPDPAIIPQDEDIPLIGVNLAANLDVIKQKIRSEEASKKEAQSKLNQNNVQAFWNKYIEDHNSNSFQAAMRHTILSLDGKKLKVIAPSPIVQGLVKQEPALMDGIRKEFGTPDLTLEVIIDKDAFPDYEEDEKVKTYYSRTEAYQEMMKINPKFAEFVKTFDLKLDEKN